MEVTVIHSAFEEEANTVAIVNVPFECGLEEAMSYAYRWTNNIMGSWSIKEEFFDMPDGETHINGDYNENVTVLADLHDVGGRKMGIRSTSMGDIMVIGADKFRVAGIGFEKLTPDTDTETE